MLEAGTVSDGVNLRHALHNIMSKARALMMVITNDTSIIGNEFGTFAI